MKKGQMKIKTIQLKQKWLWYKSMRQEVTDEETVWNNIITECSKGQPCVTWIERENPYHFFPDNSYWLFMNLLCNQCEWMPFAHFGEQRGENCVELFYSDWESNRNKKWLVIPVCLNLKGAIFTLNWRTKEFIFFYFRINKWN